MKVCCLFLVPLTMSFANISMRMLRKMNENTIQCYMNPALLTFASIIMVISKIGFGWVFELSWPSILLFIFMGTNNVLFQ